jgi:hypothetical protein
VEAGVVTNVVALVSLVAQHRERPFVDAIGEIGGDARVMGFAGRDQQTDRQAVSVRRGVEFGREATARTAETLAMSPPFAPAAQ